MKIGYADPPYPGCAHMYKNHPDYAGEVDHLSLAKSLRQYDGWCLHTSSVALLDVMCFLEAAGWRTGSYRIMSWVKPFAAFKPNVPIAYAWEPVLVKAARKPVVKKGMGFTYRDWLDENITLKRGLTGVKPERVCHWLFEAMGCDPDDELDDIYPGTYAVTNAWETWRNKLLNIDTSEQLGLL